MAKVIRAMEPGEGSLCKALVPRETYAPSDWGAGPCWHQDPANDPLSSDQVVLRI